VASNWYVLHCKYRKEESLYQFLVKKGYQVFYPRLRVDPVNPRAKKEKPYFPQYMFVFSDLSKTNESVFMRMPYVITLVKFAGEPAIVPQPIIAALQTNIEEINRHQALEEEFYKGESVRINKGPFSGYEGVFDKNFSGEERVQILLTLLQDKKIKVDVSKSDITKKD